MNSAYLGDALDHWKGALFSYLGGRHLLGDLAADPMLTDPDKWYHADFAIYARLLRIPKSRVIQHTISITQNRSAYFEEISHRGDIFLDPDVGIATSRVRNQSQYVQVREIDRLLSPSGDRIVVIYQHIRGCKARERVDVVVGHLPSGCSWSSYESGTVAMLFIARKRGRVEEIFEALRHLLGRHGENRVRAG
jgi:hypothetical protein